jgi:uncharacterized protein YeaO (DUF488 family)
MTKHEIRIKRAYDAPARGDGFRVLVDRVWPRGLSKDDLQIDLWVKEIAPSTKLRQWFGHDPERWMEFRERYERELKDTDAHDEIRNIIASAKDTFVITLVYGAKDAEHNQAVVLKGVFEKLSGSSPRR